MHLLPGCRRRSWRRDFLHAILSPNHEVGQFGISGSPVSGEGLMLCITECRAYHSKHCVAEDGLRF